MQVRACSSAWDSDPRQAPDDHQRRLGAPPAGTTSPPNSTWYHAETRYKEWGCCLHFGRVLLAPSFYKRNTLQSGGRTHAHQSSNPTCPFGITTLHLHSSTMLDACLLQPHGAIYSQSRALRSWRSDDTVTTWSWDLQTCARIKATPSLPCLATSLIASASLMPEPRYKVT
jgi:hypothetical protein